MSNEPENTTRAYEVHESPVHVGAQVAKVVAVGHDHTGHVSLALAPEAARELAKILQHYEFLTEHLATEPLEPHDTALWSSVAVDLIRHRIVLEHNTVSHSPAAPGADLRLLPGGAR